MKFLLQASAFLLAVFATCAAFADSNAPKDWLLDPSGFVAQVEFDEAKKEWRLTNGVIERRIVVEPSAATVSFKHLRTGEELIRAVGPEARVVIDGTSYPIGGLTGQPVLNYFKEEWIPTLKPVENSYRFESAKIGEIEKPFEWKKRPEWLSKDLAWPPKGKSLRMSYKHDAVDGKVLPTVDVYYEIYDGIPVLQKRIEVLYPQEVEGAKPAPEYCVDSFVSEELQLVEPESRVEDKDFNWNVLNLYVENDYIVGYTMSSSLKGFGHRLELDPGYRTQVCYRLDTPCRYVSTPEFGPAQYVRPGENFVSYRSFELFYDGTDRERRGLARRRMYRTLAPWTAENPLMFHKTQAQPEVLREAIEQCRETGFETIIMSFGSGFNLESTEKAYRDIYREIADEAKAAGLGFGGYSLTSSRNAGTLEDNVKTANPKFKRGPCLGADWGQRYFATLKEFMEYAGFSIFENDGPYPGDPCESDKHPGHRGKEDSVWVQWKAQSDLYRWCRERGIYVNQPDTYFFNGGNKTGMGYRETNWSLPRAEQVIIERQNIYDGTWEKTASMGWMFVPLSQYHGGGAAATIEPLREHLDHYDARFANLLGAGVQACYRGPRLYDSEETKAVVKKWVNFYKSRRQILDADLIHLRRADGRDWDGWLHVDPSADVEDRGLAFFYNPLKTEIVREIELPLYYTGLTGQATIRRGDSDLNLSEPFVAQLDGRGVAKVEIRIAPESYSWLLIQK